MLDAFEDLPGRPGSAHAQFQSWRSQYPVGFVLNFLTATKLMLHTTTCAHFGDTNWRCSPDGANSLTKRRKVCSDDMRELLDFASKRRSIPPSICESCTPIMPHAVNAESEWTLDELRASVRAYLEIRRKLQAEERINKRSYYKALAIQFGRSEKAFEYRMCNISYVLSIQGRAWLPGLLPRSNVGVRVAEDIERLLAEEEKHPLAPAVGFAMQVSKSRKNKALEQPKGNHVPQVLMSASTRFERDAAVKAWVLENANGVCECCETRAPFVDNEGFPYLEVHHVHRLADGGADTVNNAVAVCPNCHRALHHGREAMELVERLRRRLKRLAGE